TNVVNTSFNESYSYDNLNQVTNFSRGSHTIAWSLDPVGNFSSTATDGGSAVNRTHNKQNEVTAVGGSTLTFDSNGNTTTDDNGKTLVSIRTPLAPVLGGEGLGRGVCALAALSPPHPRPSPPKRGRGENSGRTARARWSATSTTAWAARSSKTPAAIRICT